MKTVWKYAYGLNYRDSGKCNLHKKPFELTYDLTGRCTIDESYPGYKFFKSIEECQVAYDLAIEAQIKLIEVQVKKLNNVIKKLKDKV